jgi:hypothetical protein
VYETGKDEKIGLFDLNVLKVGIGDIIEGKEIEITKSCAIFFVLK